MTIDSSSTVQRPPIPGSAVRPAARRAAGRSRRRLATWCAVVASLGGAVPVIAAAGPVAAGVSTSGGLTTSVSAPTQVAAGSTLDLTTSVSSATARSVIVDLEIYDASGRRVHQAAFERSLAAGQPVSLASRWAVPATLASGRYTAKVGVFRPGWQGMLHWNDDAARFDVVVATAPKVLSTSATIGQGTARPGTSVPLTVRVTSDVARNLLVDVEIYDASGRRIHQFWWDNTSIAAGQTRSLSTNWAVPANLAPGSYTVMVGLFGVSWSSFVQWNDRAGSVQIQTTNPPATTTTTVPAATTTTTTTVPATTTTTVAATTTTTTVPATTTTTTTPTTTTVPSAYFATLPPGAQLPSGDECAARVRPAAEIRASNYVPNHTRGTSGPNSRTDWSGFARVDGDFVGTTDEIIQWTACKWGIDEDMVRAQVVKESWWNQSANGDNGESFGLGQVRVGYHDTAFPDAINSSAYNLDYTYATWRACYEGVYTWLNQVERGRTYAAGDAWGCMGVWFSGRWYTAAAVAYIEGGDTIGYGNVGVKEHLAARTWATPDFLNG